MELPKNNAQLEKIFKEASLADVSRLDGEYYVDMLTGILPSIRRFSHRKFFYHENGQTFGCNIIFNDIKWGYFFVETQKIGDSLQTVINYRHPKNSFLTNKIRDYIRCVEEDKIYIGRFNYLLNGKIRFLGYFSLRKK